MKLNSDTQDTVPLAPKRPRPRTQPTQPPERSLLKHVWANMAEDTAANKRTRTQHPVTWPGVLIAAAIFVALAWFVGALFGQP